MNTDTGHLASMEDLLRAFGSEAEVRRRGYEPVPSGTLAERAERLMKQKQAELDRYEAEMRDNLGFGVVVPQADPLTRAMKRVRALRKKAAKKARKRNR